MTKPLNIYFFSIKTDDLVTTDFGLQYTQEGLAKEIMSKLPRPTKDESPRELIIEVLGEMEIKKVLDLIDSEKLDTTISRKLKKQEFINNLMYTKDYLLKDSSDKDELERILKKI